MSEKKMMIRQGRQGDVLITKLDKPLKGDLTPIEREDGRVVLAHGEVTGHAHAIKDANCSLFADDRNLLTPDMAMSLVMRAGGGAVIDPEGDRILRVTEAPVDLAHEEHDHFGIPIGDNEVRRQTEYDPEAEAGRRIVAD